MGERRIGVAVSDPTGRVATPLKVIAGPLSADMAPFQRIVEDYEPGRIVVGLPLSLDGSEGPQAARIRREGAQLARVVPVDVVYYDERLSSVAAQRAMAEAGADSRARRGAVDMVAASIMLQAYLDSTNKEGNE